MLIPPTWPPTRLADAYARLPEVVVDTCRALAALPAGMDLWDAHDLGAICGRDADRIRAHLAWLEWCRVAVRHEHHDRHHVHQWWTVDHAAAHAAANAVAGPHPGPEGERKGDVEGRGVRARAYGRLLRVAVQHPSPSLPAGEFFVTMHQTLQGLPSGARTTLAALAALPPGTVADALDMAVVRDLPLEETGCHLALLAARELLEPAQTTQGAAGPFRVAGTVRGAVAGASACPDRDPRLLRLRRWADWLLMAATVIDREVTPSHHAHYPHRDYQHPPRVPDGVELPFAGTEAAAVAWLTPRQDSMAAAVRAVHAAGWHPLTVQFTVSLWPMWHRLRPSAAWTGCHELALASARRAGDAAGERIVLSTLAVALRSTGRHQEAIDAYKQVRAMAAKAGDLRMQAQALNGIGHALTEAGQYDQALSPLKAALLIRQETGYARGVGLTTLLLGRARAGLEDYLPAANLLEEARDRLAAVPDPYDAARALMHLGHVSGLMGHHDQARDHLDRAAGEFQALGQHHG
ncbi:tetratricopeptide repeat protein, partial [Streptomyces specialis]|uniref:tetratricopeptide repeat protein n=1 Tax=Streptomyces specialis TaxID=498367 RepID=UPI00131E95A4